MRAAAEVGDESDPQTYREAKAREDEGWQQAMEEEIAAHKTIGTWILEDRPPGANVISGKWVYKTKYALKDGVQTIVRRKARYVARGCGQKAGIDYFETYAPTVKYSTVRVILQLATVFDWDVKQLDVTTAYLQAPMKETVYMRQPEGFVDAQRPHAVCRLVKSIYGTKQAGHNWNEEVNRFITQELGYVRTAADPCLYRRRSASGELMTLALFVDDVIASHPRSVDGEWLALKAKFLARFPSTDGGDVSLLLGMRITRDRIRRTLKADQEAYVRAALKTFGLEDCKPSVTPSMPGVRLSKRDQPSMEQQQTSEHAARLLRYQQLMGTLLYAAITSRPDILQATAALTRFMSNPGDPHWQAALQVLRYLRGSMTLGLQYKWRPDVHGAAQVDPMALHASDAKRSSRAGVHELCLTVWCDADWASDEDSRRSTTGVLVTLFGCSIVWLSKRQPTVALSSTEAEYMALARDAMDAWIVGGTGAAHTTRQRGTRGGRRIPE
jgi:hypothetical protein